MYSFEKVVDVSHTVIKVVSGQLAFGKERHLNGCHEPGPAPESRIEDSAGGEGPLPMGAPGIDSQSTVSGRVAGEIWGPSRC